MSARVCRMPRARSIIQRAYIQAHSKNTPTLLAVTITSRVKCTHSISQPFLLMRVTTKLVLLASRNRSGDATLKC